MKGDDVEIRGEDGEAGAMTEAVASDAAGSPITVSLGTTSDVDADAFVRAHPEANLCHLPAYGEMVRRASGHDALYLVARRGSAVRGVLPLTHAKSLLFGSVLVSHAFRNYGGPLAVEPEAQRALFERACELAHERGCQSIEFRNVTPMPFELTARHGKACMVLPLDPDPERVWKAFDSEIRNRVRKAEKSGLATVIGGAELVDEFYDVYTYRMRELGTPCYPKALMRAMAEVFPENCWIFLIKKDDLAVGGAITTLFNGLAENPYVATLTPYNKLSPNNLIYWSAIRHFCTRGATRFDFGRCTIGSGAHEFKRRWGTEQIDLHYQYWVRPGHTLSIASPDNPRYQRRVEMWQRLPLWVTRRLGPIISRGVP